MENEENPNCGFPIVSHSPWKSLRDSHIPTAAKATAWKSGNPKAGFPLSHRGFSSPNEGRKEVSGEREAYSSFRLIFGLENAVPETRRTQGCEDVLSDLTRVPFTISPMKSTQETLREAVRLAAQETWRLPWELPTGPYHDFKHAASQSRLSRSKQTTLWNYSTFRDQWKTRPSDSPERLQKQLGRMAFTLALSVTRDECIVMLVQWFKQYGRNYNPLHLLEVTDTGFNSWKVQERLQEKTLTNTLKNQQWREAQRAKTGKKKRTTQQEVLAALPATKAELMKALDVSVDSIDGHLRRMHFEGKVEEVSPGRWVVASEHIVNP